VSSAAAVIADEDSNFLLSLQVLLDLCGTQANAAIRWVGPIKIRRLRVSCVTIAQAKAEVLACSDQTMRERLNARLTDLLAKIEGDGGPPLPFGAGAANVWQGFMMEPVLGDMPQVDRQFYASAVYEGLVIIEYEHDYSAALQQLGIRVQSLS